ncbi:MAG: serine/threonine protein kinase, partial [Chloroflexi bacterium]|nr:serine/threonine protein kinase [Chloroflexota bacterium]
MSIHAGALVGRYRVVREVGEGDFATVCRAYDAEQRRLVTIKILHAGQSQDATVAQRFQQEAAAAMRLAGHPHVLGVYATGQVEGRLFVVAEFLAGATLDRCLSAPLDLALAARVVTAVAAALDAAHGVGLVHRDLSPAHVVLGRDGRIAVADFGVAGLVSLAKRPTQAIRVLGTPEYLAPELATGASPSPASDQYALAVVAFEVLAGQRPFQGDDPLAVLYAHTHEQPLAPTTLRPDLPPAVDDVVLRALAKDPLQRFPTCAAFAAALAEALGLPSGPQRSEPPPTDRTLDALVERTRGLVRSGDFATALRALQVALAVLPEDQRLRDLQAELDEEQRFAERYERALLHVRAHEWRPAREILNGPYAERPDYRDAADLRA